MFHTTNTEILADRKVPSYLDLGLVGLKLARESLTRLTAHLQTLLPSAVGIQGWEGAGLERKSCISGSHASPRVGGVCGCSSSGRLSAVAAHPFCPVQHSVFTMWWELSDGRDLVCVTPHF